MQAEGFDAVAQLAQRSGGGSSGQARADDDDFIFAAVGRAD
ncbi:MAG: hypothetical protein ACTFAK_09905 [Candidatus Electronema sp. VV]